ncbi:MAG: hypothetical protein M4579_002187 [Chaenotheca gracillima]|nr:MAG: hypothetical protein M4579_002187 [Chaenotheca gracillima]
MVKGTKHVDKSPWENSEGKEKASLELSGLNELDNDERVKVLGIIDQLRELGINEDLSLPQLVVVGDQSSGKSSLLEGLTGLEFPVASELCTRFSTQIVLRRAPAKEACVKISIIPGPTANADQATKEKLLSFGRALKPQDFGNREFGKLLDEAAEHMGLPGSSAVNLEDLDKRFSDDILKIELSGPEHSHLSVVDVPGLFHNPTKYQTEEDRLIIRNLIENYITDKRTIILAVMDARYNLANQEVFHMARAADPEGARTVGIITKCDALQEGDEPTFVKVLNIARNEVERLNHGWFAVKNRSTEDIKKGVSISQRHINERQFFTTAPWNGLRKERVGIASLKAFLGQLLFNHIRKEFPGLVTEIESLLAEAHRSVDDMGPSRQTTSERRRFLTRAATKYQQEVSNALSGNYQAGLDLKSPRKLRMHLRLLNEEFADRITRYGHQTRFRTIDGDVDPEFASDQRDDDIYDWIRTTYRDSRGAELPGTVNPAVLEGLFRQQSRKWVDIASKYLVQVNEAVSAYNCAAFGESIADDDIRRKLRTRLESQGKASEASARVELGNIVRDEQEGILQTVNHYFADNLAKTREARTIARMKSVGLTENSQPLQAEFHKMVKNLHLSNEDQAVNDIHDILKAYYKVAMKRFMDNVVLQTTERHILGATGPVKVFAPEFVGGFSETELADLAAENYTTSRARTDIDSRVDRLQKALEIARQAAI